MTIQSALAMAGATAQTSLFHSGHADNGLNLARNYSSHDTAPATSTELTTVSECVKMKPPSVACFAPSSAACLSESASISISWYA